MAAHSNSLSSARKMVESLFPANVVCVLSDGLPPDFQLAPAERPHTPGMAETRFAEFCHGRHCARLMLRQLGFPNAAIPVGAHRQPLWPAGVVGSIAHWRNLALAVGARAEQCGGLGVDLESAEALATDLSKLIYTPAELEAFAGVLDAGLASKVLFSIKESIFKCLWPTVRAYFDFLDVEVRANGAQNEYSAVGVSCDPALVSLNRLHGRYTVTEQWIISSAVLH
jgi:4'-phosphopantetheinyl transferase EntD